LGYTFDWGGGYDSAERERSSEGTGGWKNKYQNQKKKRRGGRKRWEPAIRPLETREKDEEKEKTRFSKRKGHCQG